MSWWQSVVNCPLFIFLYFSDFNPFVFSMIDFVSVNAVVSCVEFIQLVHFHFLLCCVDFSIISYSFHDIQGKYNKLRIYYLSWLKNKIVKGEEVVSTFFVLQRDFVFPVSSWLFPSHSRILRTMFTQRGIVLLRVILFCNFEFGHTYLMFLIFLDRPTN